VKSANLGISAAQANLMMARGAFDPKIEIDYDKNNSRIKNIIRYSTVALKFQLGMVLK